MGEGERHSEFRSSTMWQRVIRLRLRRCRSDETLSEGRGVERGSRGGIRPATKSCLTVSGPQAPNYGQIESESKQYYLAFLRGSRVLQLKTKVFIAKVFLFNLSPLDALRFCRSLKLG